MLKVEPGTGAPHQRYIQTGTSGEDPYRDTTVRDRTVRDTTKQGHHERIPTGMGQSDIQPNRYFGAASL